MTTPDDRPAEREAERFSQAILSLTSGRLEESIHHFKEIARDFGEAGTLPPKSLQDALRKMFQGEEGLTLAIQQQPGNFDVRTQRVILRLGRAILLSLLGGDPGPDCKGAFEDAGRAVDLRKDDIHGRINRANVLLLSARYARDSGKDVRSLFEMAKADLELAILVEENHATALHNRGIVYFYLGNVDKKAALDPAENFQRAIADLQRASGLDPTYAYIFKDLGVCRVALARILLERGERPRDLLLRATGDLTMAVDINPRLYGAYYERAMAFFSLKQFPEAVQDWERCLSLDPSRRKLVEPLIAEARQKSADPPGVS